MGQTTALQPGQADLGAGGIQFGGVIEQLGLRLLAALQSTEEGGAGGGSRQLPDDVREQQIHHIAMVGARAELAAQHRVDQAAEIVGPAVQSPQTDTAVVGIGDMLRTVDRADQAGHQFSIAAAREIQRHVAIACRRRAACRQSVPRCAPTGRALGAAWRPTRRRWRRWYHFPHRPR